MPPTQLHPRSHSTAAAAVQVRGAALPEHHAEAIIYSVSYDFVFPCVNIWEAQLMFCAQPRQLQPLSEHCHPPHRPPQCKSAPAPPTPCVQGAIPMDSALQSRPRAARTPLPPQPCSGPQVGQRSWGARPAVLGLPPPAGRWVPFQLCWGLQMLRGEPPVTRGEPLQMFRDRMGLQACRAAPPAVLARGAPAGLGWLKLPPRSPLARHRWVQSQAALPQSRVGLLLPSQGCSLALTRWAARQRGHPARARPWRLRGGRASRPQPLDDRQPRISFIKSH